jgi:hypothetical protein
MPLLCVCAPPRFFRRHGYVSLTVRQIGIGSLSKKPLYLADVSLCCSCNKQRASLLIPSIDSIFMISHLDLPNAQSKIAVACIATEAQETMSRPGPALPYENHLSSIALRIRRQLIEIDSTRDQFPPAISTIPRCLMPSSRLYLLKQNTNESPG